MIPKHLNSFLTSIIISFSFMLTGGVFFRCVKTIAAHYSLDILNPHDLHHLEISSNDTYSFSTTSLNRSPDFHMQTSSAKILILPRIFSGKKSIIIENMIGLRTDPRGIPFSRENVLDSVDPTLTSKFSMNLSMRACFVVYQVFLIYEVGHFAIPCRTLSQGLKISPRKIACWISIYKCRHATSCDYFSRTLAAKTTLCWVQ